jgi:uncharacterized protein
MPEYLSPGVYVEELQTGPRPIEGVGTSTTGMVGPTERGPEAPTLVGSWLEYQRWYGGYLPDESYLSYAVQGFFDNGGRRLFVARVVGDDAQFASNEADFGDLHIHALGRGSYGNRIAIRIRPGGKQDPNNPKAKDLFRLDVIYFSKSNKPADMANIVDWTNPSEAANPDRHVPDVIESWDNLIHTTGAPNNVETVVNANSNLIRVWLIGGNPIAPTGQFTPLSTATDATLDGGAIGEPEYNGANPKGFKQALASLAPKNQRLFGVSGALAAQSGLVALHDIDEVALLGVPDALPGAMDTVITEMVNQCEELKDRFAVVSAGRATTKADLIPPQDTFYAAFYGPWIEVYDPVSRGPLLIPPTGHVLGLIARTDIERGVHKAPANEVVRDAINLEVPVTRTLQDVLNPKGVNCIRDFRSDGRGIRLWGARTMSSDPEWKYVNVRRLFIFVEESIDEGTQWVVFEPNDEPLWAQVRRSIANFLFGVWRSGALMGLTQEEAFFVKCDRTTMTQDDIDNGRLVCYIGIAPVKPAEFVIFRISQKTAEAPA